VQESAVDICVIADLPVMPDAQSARSADLLLSCGDVPDHVIIECAEECGCDAVFAVKGNHDSSAPFRKPIRDVHLDTEDFQGLTFGGFNGCWRYKPRGHYLYEQRQVTRLMQDMPPVDIFIAHNSPAGIHESDRRVHQGFSAFNQYIDRCGPALFFHGHQHTAARTERGRTSVVGVYGRQFFRGVP
jgi:Icc-related predicted phosphoesterase